MNHPLELPRPNTPLGFMFVFWIGSTRSFYL